MKAHWILILSLALSGCGVEVLTTGAITADLNAQQASAMKRQIEHAAGTSGKINLQRAIDTYRAENGAPPPSLDALAPGYIPTIPNKPDGTPYGYDPSTGAILENPVMGPTPEDFQAMQRISAAIFKYGKRTRRYPASLEALVPNYLPTLPTTADGQAFLYDPRTGRIAHPTQPPMPVQGQAGPGAYGGGPMGEAMTGIAVQQRLNRRSNAGANAAGNRAGDASRGFGNARSQHQLDVMDDLGL